MLYFTVIYFVLRCKSRGVQTGMDVGLVLSSQGLAEAAAAGAQFVEPASVATAVVSAHTLEGTYTHIGESYITQPMVVTV